MKDNSCFIDTNILIYSVGDDEIKREIAIEILKNHHIVISSQVLNEFCNAIIRKKIITENDMILIVQSFIYKFDVINIDSQLILQALKTRKRFGYSYWDSLIVSTALYSSVPILYSEDMHHNQVIDDKLTIINPFK